MKSSAVEEELGMEDLKEVKLPTPRVAHSFAILRFAPEWGIWETKADTNRK